MFRFCASKAKIRNFFMNEFRYSINPYNHPNEYDLDLLIIICNDVFYDKNFKLKMVYRYRKIDLQC